MNGGDDGFFDLNILDEIKFYDRVHLVTGLHFDEKTEIKSIELNNEITITEGSEKWEELVFVFDEDDKPSFLKQTCNHTEKWLYALENKVASNEFKVSMDFYTEDEVDDFFREQNLKCHKLEHTSIWV